MSVTIVLAGECIPAFIALVTDLWRRPGGLDVHSRGGRKRRRVRVMEDSRSDKRGRGDVLVLMGRTVVTLLVLLLLRLLRGIQLEGLWLWVAG